MKAALARGVCACSAVVLLPRVVVVVVVAVQRVNREVFNMVVGQSALQRHTPCCAACWYSNVYIVVV